MSDLDRIRTENLWDVHVASLFVIATVCDKPMKNKSANMIQHNGYYSCTYCFNKGESFSTANGGNCVAYPPHGDRSFRLRSELTYHWAMDQQNIRSKERIFSPDLIIIRTKCLLLLLFFIDEKSLKGHYGPIALQSLRFHSFPTSFLVESMHSVYHGELSSRMVCNE